MNSEHDDIENKPGNFFSRLKNALRGKKDSIKNNLANIIKTKKIDEEILEEIETELIMADIGVPTTEKIINQLKIITLMVIHLLLQELQVDFVLMKMLNFILKPIL